MAVTTVKGGGSAACSQAHSWTDAVALGLPRLCTVWAGYPLLCRLSWEKQTRVPGPSCHPPSTNAHFS